MKQGNTKTHRKKSSTAGQEMGLCVCARESM